MQPEILDYVRGQSLCVLGVEMPDGSPHLATVHFAHTEEPVMFLFETNREYRKSEALFSKDIVRASVVVGCDENDRRTLQMDGKARLMTETERPELFDKVYLQKFPKKVKKDRDNKLVAFLFTPTWWRFTDFTKLEGKLVLSSN